MKITANNSESKSTKNGGELGGAGAEGIYFQRKSL